METLGQPAWFGQYRLTSRIATGGMAEVYLGRHITPDGQFGPMVAVKRLLPHLIKDQSIVRMFLNEARITAQINHENVVRIVDLGNEAGEPYIAMELLDGRTFADLREKVADEGKRVPLGITLLVLSEACRGLDAAHRAVDEHGQPLRLVHRDFTPDNIHVGFAGDVKVIDFGVAKTAMWGAGTEPGTLKGKFFYMSPEMILARPVDHRADVFATGVMLYEQLTGRRPFTGNSVDEVVMRIAQGNPRPPRAMDPSVPPQLEAVCLQALEHDPNRRFQSLDEFVVALQAIGGDAKLATREQLGKYVETVFPKEKDPRHQTLRKARLIDPSQPHMPTPAHGSGEAQAQLAQDINRKVERISVSEPPLPVASPEPPVNPGIPTPAEMPKVVVPTDSSTKKKAPLLPIIAALVVLAGAATIFLVLRVPELPPEQALIAARETADAKDRAALLISLRKGNGSADQLRTAGALLLEVKQWNEALEVADAWQKKTPDDARAYLLEAKAAIEVRKGKRAEAALDKAGQLAPDDGSVDVVRAGLRETQGDTGGALDAWSKAAKKNPKLREARERQGYWLSQAGRLDEANAVLTQVLKEKFDGVAAAELGFVRFRKGDVKGALALLKDTVKREPKQMAAHYYLGAVLFAQGDVKGARAEYQEADKLAPTDSRPLAALCEMEARTNAPELESTKQLITSRFPGSDGTQILARCTAPPKEPESP